MFVADHGSVDATPDILRQLAREDSRLVAGRATGIVYAQSERLTGLMRCAFAATGADFILPLDPDEFLRAESRAAVVAALRSIPPGEVGLIPWQTYVVPEHPDLGSCDPPRTLTVRRVRERPGYRKVAIRADGIPIDSTVIEMGSHAVRRADGTAIPMPDLAGIQLVHVPVRGREQMLGKIMAHWLTVLAQDPAAEDRDVATHWRDLFEHVIHRGTLGDDELRAVSITYAQDSTIPAAVTELVEEPIHWTYERRYSTGAPLPALLRVARAWRASIHASRGAAGRPEADVAGLDFPDLEQRTRALGQHLEEVRP